ncbi:MAG: Ig-like domain-containing protein [Clostridia bacterium]|nr:Ig-like domain-containing protein [Clostridia bacterium]
MKNRKRTAKICALLLALTLLLPVALSSCIKDDPPAPTASTSGAVSPETQAAPSTETASVHTPTLPDNAVRSLRLSKNGLTLKINTSERLSFTASPSDADLSVLFWESDDPATVEVDGDGRVTAKQLGSTVVRLSTRDGRLSVSCTVVVTDEEMTVIPVVSVKFAEPVVVLTEGESAAAQYAVMPLNATNRTVGFSSENSEIGAIDAAGKIEAKAPGMTRLTVRSGLLTGTCVLIVRHSDGSLPAEARSTLTVTLGKSRSAEIPIVEFSRIEGLNYVSTDPSVAAAVDGIDKGIVKGTAAVDVKNKAGIVIYRFDVKVVGADEQELPVEGIVIDPSSVQLEVGGRVKLNATLLPEGAKKLKVTWICENKELYSVSEDGEVIALKAGNTVVTAYVQDGDKSFTKTCRLYIRTKDAPEIVRVLGVTVVNDSFKMKVGETVQIEYVVLPKNATDQRVIFIIEPSGDDKARDYVSVTDTGLVTALRAGKGYITLCTADGNKTKGVWFTITE